jgi:hypothetical protein
LDYKNEDILTRRSAKGPDKDEIRPQYQDSTVDGSAIFTSSLVRNLGPQFGVGSTIDALDTIEVNSVGALNELATPWYSDQILPFDVTLAGANEYGAMAAAKIFGIEILNEGTGHRLGLFILPDTKRLARAWDPGGENGIEGWFFY